jgi:hypothetical protein
MEHERVNQNYMEKMGMHKAYLVSIAAWATVALPFLQSLYLLCGIPQAVTKCE